MALSPWWRWPCSSFRTPCCRKYAEGMRIESTLLLNQHSPQGSLNLMLWSRPCNIRNLEANSGNSSRRLCRAGSLFFTCYFATSATSRCNATEVVTSDTTNGTKQSRANTALLGYAARIANDCWLRPGVIMAQPVPPSICSISCQDRQRYQKIRHRQWKRPAGSTNPEFSL